MKKLLLLVAVALLPLFGFSQSDLVKWGNNNALTTSYVAANISSGNITASGVQLSGAHEQHNTSTSSPFWTTSASINLSQYIQFTAKPVGNYQITPTSFNFVYSGVQGVRKYQVRYSKDSNFTGGGTVLVAESSLLSGDQTIVGNFPAGFKVLPSETLYIRFYAYDNTFTWYSPVFFKHGGNANVGPRLRGTVTPFVNLLTANNDTGVLAEPNQTTAINVLGNDTAGSAPINSVVLASNPSHGTAVWNSVTNKFDYTPQSQYFGSDSFTYTISNGVDPNSTATVNISVQYITPTAGALCGTYYIGTAGHFATLTQAVNYANTNGINCNVTFSLINTNYSIATGEAFPITINGYNGSNTYSLTIKPNAGVNATIQANNAISTTVVRSVFKLDGAKNIIFNGSNNNTTTKNLTVINNCNIVNGSDRTVFWLMNSANTVTLKNLTISQGNENADSSFSSGIFSGSNSTPKGTGSSSSSNLTITNNSFAGVKQGIYVDDNNVTNVTVTENKFGEGLSAKTQNTIYLSGVTTFHIYKNEMKGINSTFSNAPYTAIYVNGSNGTINKNIIYSIKRDNASQVIAGIWLASNVGTNAVNVSVNNNFITDVQTPGSHNNWGGGAYGLYIENGNGYKIYHNSINLKQQFQSTGISSALLVNNGTNLDVRNNIFNNNLSYSGGGKAAVTTVNYTSTTFAYLDYNNYYSAGVVGIKENINSGTYPITTLAAWRTAVGKDTNSTAVQPAFVNENNDLHLVPGNIVNVQHLGGVTGLGILDDIDGEERYIPRPTMGADEIEETHCGGTVTWNGTSWSNGMPNTWTGDESIKIIIAGPYTMGNANLLKSCQLEIIADPNAKLIIGENATYIVEDKLTLNNGSVMIIQDKGSFVQVSEPDKNSIHPNATFEVHRKSQAMYRYDFTYWSSPVQGFKLKNVSPTTLFDKFYSWNASTQAWTVHKSNLPEAQLEVMGAGKGYIVRAPQSYSVNPTQRNVWESVFVGKPNNGVQQVTVSNGSANQWNLIGNPYASAVDAAAFMTANQNVLEGAIYLWTHSSEFVPTSDGSQVYTYAASDYATWNLSGGTRSANGGAKPEGKIASGQSFFIKGKTASPSGNQAVFNNAMRVKAANQNGQFFRPGGSEPINDWETTGKHRIWLNLTSAQNDFNQTMVGYIENATNELDWGYDADVFSGGVVSLYSVNNQKNLTIQGRALPFNNQDEVPLGYKTTLTGTLKISIDEVDGLFSGQDIYLEDKVLNIVHNLKDSEYSFTTVPGTFNERFVLRYVPAQELGIDTPTVDANSIVVFRNGSQIDIKSKDQTIEHVTVYDLLGKVIFDKAKINAQSFSTSQLTASNQVVIVKVITDTQAEVVKKVIMN